jgi:hypothetical protein
MELLSAGEALRGRVGKVKANGLVERT